MTLVDLTNGISYVCQGAKKMDPLVLAGAAIVTVALIATPLIAPHYGQHNNLVRQLDACNYSLQGKNIFKKNSGDLGVITSFFVDPDTVVKWVQGGGHNRPPESISNVLERCATEQKLISQYQINGG